MPDSQTAGSVGGDRTTSPQLGYAWAGRLGSVIYVSIGLAAIALALGLYLLNLGLTQLLGIEFINPALRPFVRQAPREIFPVLAHGFGLLLSLSPLIAVVLGFYVGTQTDDAEPVAGIAAYSNGAGFAFAGGGFLFLTYFIGEVILDSPEMGGLEYALASVVMLLAVSVILALVGAVAAGTWRQVTT